MTWLLLFACCICVGGLIMTVLNLRHYRTVADDGRTIDDLVSVCIPARNEEENLDACVTSMLASTGVRIEVLVYDDQSTDCTPQIINSLIARDARVRLVPSEPLPPEWNGKQHACWRMSRAAAGRWFLFTDADVRSEPGAVRAAVLSAMTGDPARGLVSTFPRQITESMAEKLVVPMIFFILFSYLPFGKMKRSTDPAASAGCGQFLLVRQDAYAASGGHDGFRSSMHDGIKMPRAVRRAGFATDLFDGTSLVSCRMYRSWPTVWRGFAKNAYEGLGSVGLLVFVTVLHLVGHLVPWATLVWAMLSPRTNETNMVLGLSVASIAVAWLTRLLTALRLNGPAIGVVLHPVGIVLMSLIQWHSLWLHITGRRTWKGRMTGGGSAQAQSGKAVASGPA